MSPARKQLASPVLLFILVVGGIVAIGVTKDVVDYIWYDGVVAQITKVVLRADLIYFDSWWPMFEAALAKLRYPDQGIYENVFFERHIKFQYPPISILPIMAAIEVGLSWEATTKILNFVSYLSVYGIAICVYQTVITFLQHHIEEFEITVKFRLVMLLLAVVATFNFYPILGGQHIGQIQVFLDLLVSMAFASWLMGRKYFAGMMLALAALIKPQFALLLVWCAIRKEKRLFLGMMIVFVPAGIVSLAVFGFQEHLDYLKALSHMGKHGEVYWINQSINGLLNRLLVDATSLMWTLESFAPYDPIVHAGTLISTILLLLFGLFYRPAVNVDADGSPSMVSTLDLSTMLLILTIASPVAWYHHYGILLPIFFVAVLIAIVCRDLMHDRKSVVSLILLGVSYFLIANYFSFADTEFFSNPPINLLQSYNLYGGFMLLAALLILRGVAKRRSLVKG